MTASEAPATRAGAHAASGRAKHAAEPAVDKPPATHSAGTQAAGDRAASTQPTGAQPIAAASEPSLGKLVQDASAQVSTLIRSEIELAKLELRSSVKNAGVGVGFFAAAAVILVFSLVFGFLTLAEAIAALGVYRWLAFLIVFVLQLLLVGAFAFIGLRRVKRVKAPQTTIRTTKETVEYLRRSRG